MIPIYLHGPTGNRGYLLDEFARELVRICEEHLAQRRAAAFAFILYDLTRPALFRALEDPAYWLALDEISGSALSVFSLHESLVRPLHVSRDDIVHSIREVAHKSREVAERYFGLKEVSVPALLFFQVGEQQEIHGYVLIELEGNSANEVFAELRSILGACAKAVRDSTGRVIYHPEESFRRLERQLLLIKVKRKAGGLVKQGTRLIDLLQLLRW